VSAVLRRYMMVDAEADADRCNAHVAASMGTRKPILAAQYELDKGWAKMAEAASELPDDLRQVGTACCRFAGPAESAGRDFSKSILPTIDKGAPLC